MINNFLMYVIILLIIKDVKQNFIKVNYIKIIFVNMIKLIINVYKIMI